MNHKRKKSRSHSRNTVQCCIKGSRKGEPTPPYWDMLYHHRPRRRRDKLKCIHVKQGVDSDEMVWDLGNRKPHEYYF